MHYDKYELEDFLLDEKFRKWVLESTPELNHFWERWLEGNPHKRQLISSARAILIASRAGVAPMGQERKAKLWDQVREGTVPTKQGIEDNIPVYSINHLRKAVVLGRIDLGLFVKIAAGILLLATVGFLSYSNLSTVQEVATGPSMIVKSNPPGQKSKIFLPDGSVLHLNAGSTIVYPSTFASHERRIKLQGEGYFEVVRDSLRPFYVETDRLVTAVLGTSFNVSAYPGNGAAYVALVSGVVQVTTREASGKPVVLQPGEMARLNEQDKALQKRRTDMSDIISWKDGVMVFDNTAIDQVFARLENWYGVEITVDGAPGRHMPTTRARFDNATLDNVLNNLGFTYDFYYSIQDKNVTITFK